MRRILILHGICADSRSDWYHGVAAHYRALGCDVLVPNLPGSFAPNLDRWVKAIKILIRESKWETDQEFSLIGHSTGVMAAMRLLEGMPEGTRIGPSIFVAGFPAALVHPKLPVFVARNPKPELIRSKLTGLLAVHSTNDWRVPIEPNVQWMERELGAEICKIERAGHFIKKHGWTDWTEELYLRTDNFLGMPKK